MGRWLALLFFPAACTVAEEISETVTRSYEYRIEVNTTIATPTIETAVDALTTETMTALNEQLGDSGAARVAGIESNLLGGFLVSCCVCVHTALLT